MEKDQILEDGTKKLSPPCGKGTKGCVKKLIRKCVWWLVEPLYANTWEQRVMLDEQQKLLGEQQAAIRSQEEQADRRAAELDGAILELRGAISKAQSDISTTQSDILVAQSDISTAQSDISTAQSDISRIRDDVAYQEEMLSREITSQSQKANARIGAVSRELMKVKWRQLDRLAEETETPEDILTCKICGASHKRKEYETKISVCIFNGGKLVRYVCPDCGVTFGPTKFDRLTQKEKDEDYLIHYFGFDEGDVHEKEMRAFYMLEPKKTGVYLDWGCGRWSHVVKALREKGYDIYGYEPYAGGDEDPHIFSDINILSSMRFDGIFSNDLLEHLIDPVEDMKTMKNMLRDPRSGICHSTTCYEYMYEYTRFHTHFFTGRSNEVLAERAGLTILKYVNELHAPDKDSDFICCLYGLDVEEVRYNDRMSIRGDGKRGDDGTLVLESGALMYGPYMKSPKGKYTWHIILDAEAGTDYRVTAEKGRVVLETGALIPGDNVISYDLDEMTEDVEVVVENVSARRMAIKLIALR